MTQLFAERPLLLSLMLGVLAAGLIYGWLQTGRKTLAIAGLSIALGIPGVWALAENWVTDREQIEQAIFRIADAVEANNHATAIAIIGDESTRRQAAAELPRWIFTQADVGSISKIRIDEDAFPMQADVDMIVKVEVSGKTGSIQNLRVPRRLLLMFEKRGDDDAIYGGWVVTQYRHMSPIGNPDRFATGPIPQN